MELVYATLLLHAGKKQVTEDALQKIVKAADISVDPIQIKALVAAVKDVNIDDAISKAAVAPVAAPVAVAATTGGEAAAKAAKEEKEEVKEEEAAAGLGALFG